MAAQRLGGIQVLAMTSYFSRRPTTSIAVGACMHWNKCDLDLTVLLVLSADRLVLDPSLFDGKAQQYIPFVLVSMQQTRLPTCSWFLQLRHYSTKHLQLSKIIEICILP